jgi:hypothetical protein
MDVAGGVLLYDECTASESHSTEPVSIKETSNMKLPKNLGMILLAIWLILSGLIALLNFSFAGLPVIIALIAIAAGVLILLNR